MSRHVAAIPMDEPLWRVRDLMQQRRFHHVLVTEGHRVVGVVSDRDVLAAINPAADRPVVAQSSDLATLNKRVHQVMSREIVWVTAETPIVAAGDLMLRRRISCLPVFGAGDCCAGIVTTADVMRWCLARLTPAEDEQAA